MFVLEFYLRPRELRQTIPAYMTTAGLTPLSCVSPGNEYTRGMMKSNEYLRFIGDMTSEGSVTKQLSLVTVILCRQK